MNRFLALASAIAFFSIIASCTKDKTDVCAYDSSQLKYNGFIKDIINTRCSSDGACHGTPQQPDAGGEYTSYDLIKAKVDNGSFKNRVLDIKDMPSGTSLDECEFRKLKDWYDAGAPE